MLGKKLRKQTKGIFIYIARLLVKTGIEPNYLSLFSLVLASMVIFFVLRRAFLLAALFITLTGLMDIIDGSVAKVAGKVTKFGNYLDAMIDRYVEVMFYLGFVFIGYPIQAFLALSGGLLLSYAKPRTALVINIDNRDWPSIGDRFDKILLLVIGLIIANFYPVILGIDIISALLYVMAVITHIGALQRIFYARKLIRESE